MLSLQQPLDQPTSPTTDSASQKISRAERRKAAFAAKNINSTTCENSFDDNQSLSSTPSFEIPSLHEPFSSVASYVELIAKRIRTLKKLWTKIVKYDEIVENGGGKAALNKDQMDALNRKPEVYWSLRELEDLHKQATTFENEEAVRLRRIKQEADRAHTIAIARVREEERKIADARVSQAVKSVHALLNVMPTRDVLSDQEVSVLEIFKNFMFGEVLAQQNESDQIIPSILSNLESGAEVPVGDFDLTYAHIKPLINKVLYPELTTMSPSADAPTEEQQDAEVERPFASNAADQCADAREEAADSDASTLHNAAAEMREVVEALHNFHIAEGHAPVDVYTEHSTEIVLSEEVHLDEEQDVGECGFMNPTEIRFGSVNEVDSPPMDMITEESREISTSHTVVTSMVGEAGHHQVIVDDETVTTVTSTSHIVTITDVDDAQLIAGDVAPQVTPSAAEAPEAEQASRPANQAQQPRQNKNRYRQNRYHNNGNNNAHNNGNSNMNNNGNANVNSNQNRQRSPPHQQKSQYRNHPQQNQQQPQHEPTNDGGNWQTHGPRYPRANRPQQNQYRNGNGPNNGGAPNGNVGGPGGNSGGRGGFRGRGRGGMRGGHGGNGPQHQTNAPFQPHHQQGYRGNYRRPYNANNNGPAPASTNAAPVVPVAE